ncbi:MAG: hypothetical protein WA231_24980, partial [Methylocella sp.]
QSDSPACRQAAALAQGVFNGVIQDQTGGPTHFFAPVAQHAIGRDVPKWASGDALAEGRYSLGRHCLPTARP